MAIHVATHANRKKNNSLTHSWVMQCLPTQSAKATTMIFLCLLNHVRFASNVSTVFLQTIATAVEWNFMRNCRMPCYSCSLLRFPSQILYAVKFVEEKLWTAMEQKLAFKLGSPILASEFSTSFLPFVFTTFVFPWMNGNPSLCCQMINLCAPTSLNNSKCRQLGKWHSDTFERFPVNNN